MTEKKGTITISVPNNITSDELKSIREQFKNSPETQGYILNILVSGHTELPIVIKDLLIAHIKNK